MQGWRGARARFDGERRGSDARGDERMAATRRRRRRREQRRWPTTDGGEAVQGEMVTGGEELVALVIPFAFRFTKPFPPKLRSAEVQAFAIKRCALRVVRSRTARSALAHCA